MATTEPDSEVAALSGINYVLKRFNELQPERRRSVVFEPLDTDDQLHIRSRPGGSRRNLIARDNFGARSPTNRRRGSVSHDQPLVPSSSGFFSNIHAAASITQLKNDMSNAYWGTAGSLVEALSTAAMVSNKRRGSWVQLQDQKNQEEMANTARTVAQAQAEILRQMSSKHILKKKEADENTEDRIREAKLRAKLQEVQDLNRKLEEHPWEAEKRRAAAERKRMADRPAIYHRETQEPDDTGSNLMKSIKNSRQPLDPVPGTKDRFERPRRNKPPEPRTAERPQRVDTWEAAMNAPGMGVETIHLPKNLTYRPIKVQEHRMSQSAEMGPMTNSDIRHSHPPPPRSQASNFLPAVSDNRRQSGFNGSRIPVDTRGAARRTMESVLCNSDGMFGIQNKIRSYPKPPQPHPSLSIRTIICLRNTIPMSHSC